MAEVLLATRVLSSVQSFLRESHLDKISSLSVSQEQLKTSGSILTSFSSLCGKVDGLITNLQQALFETRQKQIKVEENHVDGESHDVKPDVSTIDQSLVQINASKSEIERRIAAFMERKQVEVNDNNRREFCGIIDLTEEDDSCARTDAVFKARSGSKSHVKVSKVVNPYGPQTRTPISSAAARPKPMPSTSSCSSAMTSQVPAAIDERLSNMEKHLKLGAGPVPKDVYSRIKRLEDRVLQLEGISPEYFNAIPSVYKRQRTESGRRGDLSIKEIDQKMKELKESLLRKKQDFETEKTSEKTANDVT